VLDRFFEGFSKADKEKHYKEGLDRAFDSKHVMNESVKMKTNTLVKPPVCVLQATAKQSQDRDPHTPTLTCELNDNLDQITVITAACCTCVRKTNKVVCKHRAALCCFLWVMWCTGIAGSPVHRQRYWERNKEAYDAEATVVRFIHLATNRKHQPKLEQLQEWEKGEVKPDLDLSSDGSDDETVGVVTRHSPSKGRKRRHGPIAEYREWVREKCRKHFKLDAAAASKLRKIEADGNFARLTRSWFPK